MNKTSDVLTPKYLVYIFISLKHNKFHVGFTTNIQQRISDHYRSHVLATKNRLPLKLIHYEYFYNREDSIARERFLMSGFGREQMKQALKRTISELT